MGNSTNNTKLGIFVIVAFVLFTIAVYYIGNQQNLFGEQFQISAIFQNINGLQKGNNVRYSGINVGNVEEIIILNDSMIQVDMTISTEVKQFIKKNAIASIGSDGLVGNMIVNITPGKGNSKAVVDEDVIASYSRVEADDMLGTLGKTTENIELLSRNLLELSEQLLEGEGSIPNLINDKGLADDLTRTFKNLQATSESFKILSQNLNKGISNSMNEGDGALGYLMRDSLLNLQVDNIFTTLDTLLDERMKPIIENLKVSSESVVAASTELKRILESVDVNAGLAGAVLKDESVAQDFRETMQQINSGSEKFNENMEALKENFLFRRYFKKLEREERKLMKQAEKDSLKLLRNR